MDAEARIRELEAEVELSRRLLADAQQLAKLGSWEWDLTTNVVTWSDELYRIYGHEPGGMDVSYETFLAHVHPEDRASVDERNRRCFETHAPFEDVKRVVRADGTEFPMRTRGEMVLAEDGTPIRMIGVCEDVTLEQGRRRAMDLNDNVMQSLIVARYQVAAAPGDALRALDRAIEQCQRIVDELLDAAGEPLGPGSLRRERAAGAS